MYFQLNFSSPAYNERHRAQATGESEKQLGLCTFGEDTQVPISDDVSAESCGGADVRKINLLT